MSVTSFAMCYVILSVDGACYVCYYRTSRRHWKQIHFLFNILYPFHFSPNYIIIWLGVRKGQKNLWKCKAAFICGNLSLIIGVDVFHRYRKKVESFKRHACLQSIKYWHKRKTFGINIIPENVCKGNSKQRQQSPFWNGGGAEIEISQNFPLWDQHREWR